MDSLWIRLQAVGFGRGGGGGRPNRETEAWRRADTYPLVSQSTVLGRTWELGGEITPSAFLLQPGPEPRCLDCTPTSSNPYPPKPWRPGPPSPHRGPPLWPCPLLSSLWRIKAFYCCHPADKSSSDLLNQPPEPTELGAMESPRKETLTPTLIPPNLCQSDLSGGRHGSLCPYQATHQPKP